MDLETKLRQLFKNRADAYLNTIDESVEQGMSEDCFIKAVKEAINYTHCCKSDSEQLKALEDLKDFAYDNCQPHNSDRLSEIMERL